MRKAGDVIRSLGIWFTQDKMMEYQGIRHDRMQDAGAGEGELEWLILEMMGGPCPSCGKDWRRVEVKNALASFAYYTPSCQCWERCEVCKMPLYGVTPPKRFPDHYVCPRCAHREPTMWRLTCRICGTAGITWEGKPVAWICPGCKSKSSKSKKKALEL